MIAHVGGKAVMRAAGDPEESIGHFLRRSRHRRWSCGIPDLVRHGDVDEDVRLNRRDRELERRVSTLRLHDARGELNAAEVLVARVGRDDLHVAEHVVGQKSGHALDLVHLVDQRDDRIAAADGHRDLCAVGNGAHTRIAGSRLDRSLRRCGPHPQQALRGRGRLGLHAGCLCSGGRWRFIPGERAADELHLTLFAGERRATTARLRGWHGDDLLETHAVAAVVHEDLVALDRSEWPRFGSRRRLAEYERLSGCGVLQGAQACGAQRLGRGVQWRGLRRDVGRCQQGARKDSEDDSIHKSLLLL
jgi:hypothetical protein